MSRYPEPEPRVNAKTLAQHDGKTVRLTCKIIKLSGELATVQASDGGEIAVTLSREMHIEDTYVEIIGQVKDRSTLKALTSINLGNSLDMNAVNAVVELAHSSKGQGVLA